MLKIIKREDDDKKKLHESEMRLKYEKNKIHSRYIACICIGICIWIIITNTAQQVDFVAQLSMASTVTSIILSVIAIIMSISGEVTTEGIRNQMLETIQELHTTANIVKDINSEVKDNILELKKSIDELQGKIDVLPDATADTIYRKGNSRNSYTEQKTIKNRNSGKWTKKDGK